ncbi:MAG TPA: zinc-ribbon domain containing protein [Herpetosiphonaceae bacterium]
MSFTDKALECVDCGNQFTFTVGEQEFYAQKGFTNEPRRCPACRQAKKSQRSDSGNRSSFGGSRDSYGSRDSFGGGGRSSFGGGSRDSFGGGPREMFEATCAECGTTTTVPFKPTQGRPVYCRDCFQQQRSNRW